MPSTSEFQQLLPDVSKAELVISAPGNGPGYWGGGPSATLANDGSIVLAYRLRRPVTLGRGFRNVVATSADGINFETVCTFNSDDFDTESLERPWIMQLAPDHWRVYLSIATSNTKHWKVVAIDAPSPGDFQVGNAVVTMPGSDDWAEKDPVIKHSAGQWQAWICCHPLERPEDADRMESRYATSTDGIKWDVVGTAISGRSGKWDERGARIGDVIEVNDQLLAYYDGCRTADEDTEEQLGLATAPSGRPDRFTSISDEIAAGSGAGSGSIRYVSALQLRNGDIRLYFEAARTDGAHDLYTQLVTAP